MKKIKIEPKNEIKVKDIEGFFKKVVKKMETRRKGILGTNDQLISNDALEAIKLLPKIKAPSVFTEDQLYSKKETNKLKFSFEMKANSLTKM